MKVIFNRLADCSAFNGVAKKIFLKKIHILLLFTAAGYVSCNQPAGNGKEAAGMLTSVKSWEIYEIRANDAPIFKDGKMIQQFGGVEFNRYMVEVSLHKNGTFEGKFNEGGEGSRLVWRQEDDQIVVAAADAADKRGQWTILARDVFKNRFVMQTTTTAYSYPNSTTVGLYFKAK
ncbi:hypothetical protein DYBT9275_02131 [Dyadobacter sp. CECT 9275]|uniref:Lipocalin-like domain-containing protein n=1 Tax=Dyadobacter helix TaxID=2822344 RepID=A0A916N452_9BACT|nr:hypothetical protein [Dyadobacter sp. CECT 9275]CAG4999012.1 hypothetical protein DYBT9275_02131 [Dyadobacter sp. CECT 9275]